MKPTIIISLIFVMLISSCTPGTVTPTMASESKISQVTLPATLTPMPTKTEQVADLPQTILVVDQFVATMKTAGIVLNVNNISQNLSINEMTGINGQEFEVATTFLDPDSNQQGESLEGNYPLMIKINGGEWENISIGNFSSLLGINSGTLLEGGGSTDYDIIKAVERENFNFGMIAIPQDQDNPQAGPDNYDYGYTDFEVGDAGKGMPLMSHLLVWPSRVPNWMKNGSYDSDQTMLMMTQWITTTMQKYPQIKIWEVVNEAGSQDFFEQKLGPDYFVEFFRIARQIRPDVTLIYNDYANHGSPESGSPNGDRTQHTVEVLDKLKREGNLVDGVGVEMVIYADELPSYENVTETLKAYNMPVYVTEFAVIMTNIPGSQESRLLTQAEIYHNLVVAILKSGCKTIVYFNQSDKYSPWESDSRLPEYSSTKAIPTLFTDNYEPKPAYYAVLKALYEEFKN